MRKKLIILPVLALILIGLAGLVSATNSCVFDQTATTVGTSNTYIRGTSVNLSVTLTVGDEGINATTAIITISSGTITGSLIDNITVGNETYFNTTVNTLALSDKSYTFTMTIRNHSTQTELASCTRAFIPDNTIPVISGCTIDGATAGNTTPNLASSVSVVCTIRNATSCNVYWKDTTANAMTTDYEDVDCSYTATWAAAGSSATCGLEQNDDNYNPWYYDCTDGLNTTTGTHYKILAEGVWEPDLTEEEREGIAPQIISRVRGLDKRKVAMFGLFVVIVAIVVGFAIKKFKK